MRVYEFAREHGLTSKKLLTILKEGGFRSATHMAVLSNEEVTHIKKSLGIKEEKPKAPKKAAPAKPKESKPTSPSKSKPRSKRVEKTSQGVTPKKHTEDEPPTDLIIPGEMPLFAVAQAMGQGVGEVILELMQQGMLCNRNHILSVSTITSLAGHFGLTIKKPVKQSPSEERAARAAQAEGISRWPIVVMMGHVDHGKTTLLDFIRKTKVADKEAGGITQNISACEVESTHGKIVFLDTPGHAAFTHMRKRGAKATDIVVLVVAADDSVMPQTIEAIECAKAADVPIVVAINKIDKVDQAAIEKVKRELAEKGIVSDDWGGDITCVPLSATTGQGVDELLEMLVLQAEMLELKAYPTLKAQGFVLESNIEKGYGPVATVICLQGTLKLGDHFTCGNVTGKVRLIINSAGKKITEAGPSVPIRVIGFDALPVSGDVLEVVAYDHYLKRRSGRLKPQPAGTSAQEGVQKGIKVLPLIVKVDTVGGKEAILGAIKLLGKKIKSEAAFKVVYSGVGEISERDVDLAISTGAKILGLNVKVERRAALLAREKEVDIDCQKIIYRLLESLEAILTSHIKIEMITKKIGELEVRKVFNIKGYGIIAGCYVQSGYVVPKAKVVCKRNGETLGEGKIMSLQRNKKTVKEVRSGSECGFISSGFTEWEVDDVVECFVEVPKNEGA